MSSSGGPEELRYLPSTSTVVAFADVREVMTSELRQRFRESVLQGAQENGQREFQELTGINIETDIDRVVAGLDVTSGGTANFNGSGVVLARGRFDEVRIEALMREHGAHVDAYKGKRLITAEAKIPRSAAPLIPRSPFPPFPPFLQSPQSFSLSFVEPGLVAVGTTTLVQHVVDLHSGGGESAADERRPDGTRRAFGNGNVWAVGRFDVLRARAKIPDAVADRIPPITWFAVSGRIDGGTAGGC